MRTIEIDDDIYRYILQNAQEIGESASAILRRLLGLPAQGPAQRSGSSPTNTLNGKAGALLAFVSDSGFRASTTVKDKYLAVLSFLCRAHPAEFEKVLTVGGRARRYFARTPAEIAQSGESTQPHRIPNTDYWALTNSPTAQKQDTLARVLSTLGYDVQTAQQVVRALS